jgi:DNA-binding GntR family transcriptional regulator
MARSWKPAADTEAVVRHGDSSVDHVVEHLRSGIISGEYPHDTKLLPKAIAERCGTSFIPVR